MEPEVDEGTMEAGYSDAPAVETPPEPVVETPKVDDSMKVLQDRLEKLESRTRNAEGHIGGLNHQQKVLNETLQAARSAANSVSDAPTQAQVSEAMANPQEWEALKGDFPEWATATEKFLDAKISRIKTQPAVDPQAIARAEQAFDAKLDAAKYDIALDALNVAFEGWQEETQTDAFKSWRDAQPVEVQQLGDSRRFSDAARMLRLYEKSKVKAPEIQPEPRAYVTARQRRLEAAVNPRGSGGNDTARRTDYDDMEAGYNG
jgi:hypothetical protein